MWVRSAWVKALADHARYAAPDRGLGIRFHPRVRRLVQNRGRASTVWVTGAASDYYFHPFVLPQGYTETSLVAGWLERHATCRLPTS